MEKILPIGTIIRFKDNRFLIIGYDFGMVDDAFDVVYNALLYPIGFTGGNGCMRIPCSEEMEVVHKPETLDNRYTECLEYFRKSINDVGPEKAAESCLFFLFRLKSILKCDIFTITL